VDTRGLSCPQPVLETRRALEESEAGLFRVLVDNVTSRENIRRFAGNQGCEVAVADLGANQFEITIRRTSAAAAPHEQEELIPCAVPGPSPANKHVVYIGTSSMGKGDDVLGEKLMRGFLRTLIDVSPLPWRVIFINAGVKLTTIDEEAVDAVSLLNEKGVEILSCGTCLQHFGLENSLKVGKVTNMFEVIESFYAATKVISPD
jgi:selenium metabolism protein YedF